MGGCAWHHSPRPPNRIDCRTCTSPAIGDAPPSGACAPTHATHRPAGGERGERERERERERQGGEREREGGRERERARPAPCPRCAQRCGSALREWAVYLARSAQAREEGHRRPQRRLLLRRLLLPAPAAGRAPAGGALLLLLLVTAWGAVAPLPGQRPREAFCPSSCSSWRGARRAGCAAAAAAVAGCSALLCPARLRFQAPRRELVSAVCMPWPCAIGAARRQGPAAAWLCDSQCACAIVNLARRTDAAALAGAAVAATAADSGLTLPVGAAAAAVAGGSCRLSRDASSSPPSSSSSSEDMKTSTSRSIMAWSEGGGRSR
jgi:hypothetical protein